MKITALGTGSAFCLDNYQSNFLIENETENGEVKRMLFDCGGDIRWALKEQGLSALDIDAVYISHLHADHIGGLECLAFVNYFVKTVKTGFRPTLYANKNVMKDIWKHALQGGLSTLQNMSATLNTFFRALPVSNNKVFHFNGIEYKPIQTIHVVGDASFVHSYGLKFEINGTKVFITSDTQFAPTQIIDFIRDSDVVFHDCETSPFASGVHAHYKKLIELPEDVKAKMWLYHYQEMAMPDAQADGFRGFVQKGQVFDYSRKNTFK